METDYSDSVMIALLPITTDWCKIDLPHMTLVYCGEKQILGSSAFNELSKDACALAALSRPLTLQVTGRDLFGPEDDTEVFTLRHTTELWAMRHAVEKWNASEFPFNPHVTIGPKGSIVPDSPRYIAFDRILVSYGNDQLTFSMK